MGRALGIPAQDQGPVGGLGKVVPVGDPVDGLAQVQVGEVHLRAPLVLHGDGGDALAGLGDHAAHAGQTGDDLFQGLGHQPGQVVGGGVGVVGDDRQVGVVDRRQQVHRQPLPGLEPDQHQAGEEHQDGDGPADGGLDDHCAALLTDSRRSPSGRCGGMRLAHLDLGLVGQGQVVADDDLLAGRQGAAAVHLQDLHPLVVLQAGVHVQPLGPVVLLLEDQGAVVADQQGRLGDQQLVVVDHSRRSGRARTCPGGSGRRGCRSGSGPRRCGWPGPGWG